jgi:tRNA(Ile2) C34 agmatinyltransferase TiaS
MRFIRVATTKPSADVMSGILNCVCPECGGSMGELGREFKCQGECRTDWRQIWNQFLSRGMNRGTMKAMRPV